MYIENIVIGKPIISEKDKIDYELHVKHVEGTYRDECWAKLNLLDKIIKLAKEY